MNEGAPSEPLPPYPAPPDPVKHAPDSLLAPRASALGGHANLPHGTPGPVPGATAHPGGHLPRHPTTTVGMGGPLLVTPAGTTMVATDGMHAHLDQLAALEHELAAAVSALQVTQRDAVWSVVPAAPAPARRSEAELFRALTAAREARELSARLGHALRRAIAAYDEADRQAHARADFAAALLGAEIGPLVRTLLPGIALLGFSVFLASKMPDPGGRRAAAIQRFLLEHPGLITGPEFVQKVRQFTSGLDEATSTMLGIPAPIAILLGATGVTGVRTSARGLLAVGPLLGAFRETPVTVQRVTTTQIVDPPVGAVQRLDRVPEGDQVRIEKYAAPGQPNRFVVYVGPTETFSPSAGDEPWDLTSNVGGVGGLDVGSFRATELAMRDAGVTGGDQVQFVGFSQGGLVATMLAGSGQWNAAGIETFGAPAGNIALPAGLTGMAIRNSDDFIPMLAGPQLDHQVLQVERRAFDEGTPLPSYHAAPAHQRDAYRATAQAVDAAGSSAVRQQSAALDSFTADYADRSGATVTVTTYHAERVAAPEPTLDPRVATAGGRATSSR